MNKKEFLTELKEHLMGMPEEDVNDILEDYEEHFKIGKKNKRKESEIAKSLGEPKQIARDVRRELGSGDDISLKTSLIELWINAKKVVRRAWKELVGVMDNTSEKFNEFVVSELVKKSNHKKKEKKEAVKPKKRTSLWKTSLLLFLNLFIVIWIIISIYAAIISIFAAGISIWVSGFAVLIASLFVLINQTSYTLFQLSISGIFGGIGIICLGSLWLYGSVKLTAGFSWLVKKYFKLNKRLIKK